MILQKLLITKPIYKILWKINICLIIDTLATALKNGKSKAFPNCILFSGKEAAETKTDISTVLLSDYEYNLTDIYKISSLRHMQLLYI